MTYSSKQIERSITVVALDLFYELDTRLTVSFVTLTIRYNKTRPYTHVQHIQYMCVYIQRSDGKSFKHCLT